MKLKTILLALSLSISPTIVAEKTFSVLGDSYSTFEGKNSLPWADMWYRHFDTPRPENDVTDYEQTWWAMLDADPDFRLDCNNSWSGSTVCLTGYDGRNFADRAFITRLNNLGNPDIILIFGGTNDSWANAPIGEYKYSGWTNDDLTYFRPSFAYMLSQLQALYPKAEIYNILNSELKPEINESVREICSYYHVRNIPLSDIDKQSGHPSVAGMKSICDQVKAALTDDALPYLPIADPFVTLFGDTYYAYGTGGANVKNGFECFTSTDLKTWKSQGQALSPDDSYGTWGFWAPEVYYREKDKKYYMFYSTEEHICVATSDSPTGPFKQKKKQPIWDEKSIDTSLFVDTDGTPYLFLVRFTGGNVIWSAELTDDWASIKPETLTECIRATDPWELAKDVPACVAEGPSVMKVGDTYYLFYSCNHYQSKQYGVGYATADSPRGPWRKAHSNPILQGGENQYGTGHGAPFIDRDGNLRYVYHAHFSPSRIHPRTSFFRPMTIDPDGRASISAPITRPEVK